MLNICAFNLPSSAVYVSFFHDRREIKGYSSPQPVPQVGGSVNMLLAIYDIVLFRYNQENNDLRNVNSAFQKKKIPHSGKKGID